MANVPIHEWTLLEAARRVREKEISSRELTGAVLARIEALDPKVRAYVTVLPEAAAAQAAACDEEQAKGVLRGPFHGVPIGLKDIFCTRGVRTTCGSRILHDFIPPYDACVAEKVLAAGAVLPGKHNMDEFAMGSSTETSFFGPTHNPWDLSRIPGGSSGGTAAAVAAAMCFAGVGTDTGGSIRQPASFCGVTGIKPTYGRVSRFGMIAFASSLDQGGPMAKSAEDCALLLNVMAGFDARDSTSLEREKEDYGRDLEQPLKGLRIGLPTEYFAAGLAADVAQAIEAALAEYRKLGAQTVEISLPNSKLAVPVYYVLAPAEASSNLARFDGVRYGYRAPEYTDLADMYGKTRAQGFGAEVKRRIMIGTYVLSAGYYDAYYLKAQKLRRLIAQDFTSAFAQCDMIMGPTAPTTAFNLGEKSDDPVSMYLSDIYTIAVNLAGLPGMSVPAGFGANGRPVGLQIIGNYFSEAKMLNVAHQYQKATDWHLRQPQGI